MADANYDDRTRRPNKRYKKGSFEKEKSDVFLKKAKLSQLLADQGVSNSPFIDKYETDSSFPSSSDSENSSDEELEDNFWPQNLLADLHEVPDSEYLRFAPFVTEEELLHRRRDKIKRLMKHYKLQFHRLRSVLKKRHLKYLKSKQKLSEDINRPIDSDIRKRLKRKHKLMQHYLKSVNFPEDGSSSTILSNNNNINSASIKKRKYILIEAVKKLCSSAGCKASCMPLTSFCYAHILNDPKQRLFTNCCHTSIQGVCNYPVLIGQNPRLCPAHLEIQMLAMQREAMLKNQKRKQLEEASKAAAMQAHAMMAAQNKKPIVATTSNTNITTATSGTQQGIVRPGGVTTIPVTTSSNGTPMPININGFPLSQLSVAPRLIPINTQTGQPVDNKGKDSPNTVTVSTNLPPNASPNITRINFPNPNGGPIYAYNVMFSPNGATTTTGTTTTTTATTSTGTTIPITIQQPAVQQVKTPTIITPTMAQIKQNPVQVTSVTTNPAAPTIVNTNAPVKKS